MALSVLRKPILQTRMRSHLVGLDVCFCFFFFFVFFCRTLRLLPYFMCANSEVSGETARMRRLAWAFAGRLCGKYHNLMSWLKWIYFGKKTKTWSLWKNNNLAWKNTCSIVSFFYLTVLLLGTKEIPLRRSLIHLSVFKNKYTARSSIMQFEGAYSV